MSTLELENIKHPDNSGNNIELAADGSINVKAPNNQGIKITPTGASSTNYLDFYDTGGGPYGRLGYDHNASAMTFRTYTSEKMRLTYEGNLGLGTTTPLRKLHVASAGDTHIILQSTNAVDDSEIFEIGAGANSASKVDLTFRTRLNSGSGGAERMRITNDGYVTTPDQPVVFVSRTSTQAVTTNSSAGTILDFTSTQYNIGGHFNISNNKFTAPITGRYEISWSYGTNVNGASVYRTFIWKNNNKLTYTQLRVDSNGHTGYVFGSRTAILELSANDYIELRASCDNGTDFYGDNELRIVMTIRLIG